MTDDFTPLLDEAGLAIAMELVEVDSETGLRQHRWCQACMRELSLV